MESYRQSTPTQTPFMGMHCRTATNSTSASLHALASWMASDEQANSLIAHLFGVWAWICFGSSHTLSFDFSAMRNPNRMKTMRDLTARTNVTSHWLLHLWGWPQCDSWHGSNEIQCEKSGNACIFVRFRKTWECLMTCDICQALLKITKTLGFVLDQTCVFHSRDPLEVCIWERVNKINFFVFCTTTCCCLAHWTSFKRQILSKLMCQTAAWQQQQQKSEHNGKQKPQDWNTWKVIWFVWAQMVHAADITGHDHPCLWGAPQRASMDSVLEDSHVLFLSNQESTTTQSANVKQTEKPVISWRIKVAITTQLCSQFRRVMGTPQRASFESGFPNWSMFKLHWSSFKAFANWRIVHHWQEMSCKQHTTFFLVVSGLRRGIIVFAIAKTVKKTVFSKS